MNWIEEKNDLKIFNAMSNETDVHLGQHLSMKIDRIVEDEVMMPSVLDYTLRRRSNRFDRETLNEKDLDKYFFSFLFLLPLR